MKAEWSDDDIRHPASDREVFTVSQTALIKSAIDARLAMK